MLSAFDIMNDLRKSRGWDIAEQLMHVLEFIDSRDEAEALLEYLEEQSED